MIMSIYVKLDEPASLDFECLDICFSFHSTFDFNSMTNHCFLISRLSKEHVKKVKDFGYKSENILRKSGEEIWFVITYSV